MKSMQRVKMVALSFVLGGSLSGCSQLQVSPRPLSTETIEHAPTDPKTMPPTAGSTLTPADPTDRGSTNRLPPELPMPAVTTTPGSEEEDE